MKESYHIAGTSGTGAHENVTTYGYDAFDRPIPSPSLSWDDHNNLLGQLAGGGTYTPIDPGKTRYDVAYSDGARG